MEKTKELEWSRPPFFSREGNGLVSPVSSFSPFGTPSVARTLQSYTSSGFRSFAKGCTSEITLFSFQVHPVIHLFPLFNPSLSISISTSVFFFLIRKKDAFAVVAWFVMSVTQQQQQQQQQLGPECIGCKKLIEEGSVIAFGDALFHYEW